MTATRRAGLDLISHSAGQTSRIGTALARRLRPGDLILLSGGLGAGKTKFIQGVARGLGIDEPVTSPTFALVAEYDGSIDDYPVRFFHIDLYRIDNDITDLESFGFDEIIDREDAITAIEWPQRATSALPGAWLLAEIEPVAETKRRIRLISRGERYTKIVSDLRSEVGRGSA